MFCPPLSPPYALPISLYNCGVPSTLKAYFDHLARAGITFRYTANGPEGLLADRKVYVFAARGGFHKDTPSDSQTPFVTTFLNFIGLRDIEFVYAEGRSEEHTSELQSLMRISYAVFCLKKTQMTNPK